MLTTKIVEHLKRHTKLCHQIYAFTLEWDDSNSKLVLTKSRKRLLLNKVILVLHLAYLILMTNYLLRGDITFEKRLQGAPFLLLHIAYFGLRWNWDSKNGSNGTIDVINSLLQFERAFLEGIQLQKSLQDKIFCLTQPLYEASCYLTVVGALVILLTDPCSPPFLTSIFSSCSKNDSDERSVIRSTVWILILILEMLFLLNSVVSGVFYGIYGFVAGVVGLLDFLEILERQIDQCYLEKIRHIKKPNGRKCFIEILQRRTRMSCCVMYRQIQLIAAILNSNVKELILPVLVWIIPGVEIVCLYVCIKFHGTIAMPGFMIFPIVFQDACIANIGFLSIASVIFRKSGNLLIKLRNPGGTRVSSRKLEISKRLKSCRTLKVEFGLNFIDNATPLIIQNFCISQTVSLLLVSK